MNEVRALTRAEIDRAATVLTRAFTTCATYLALFSHLDEEARQRALFRTKRGFVASSVRYHDARGIFVDGELAGCTLVMRPFEYPLPFMSEAIQTWSCALTGVRAGLKFLKMRSHIMKRHIKEPHTYLFVLGVDPAHQKKGLGRELLAALHEDADAQDVASYLETDCDNNMRLYQSVGYEVLTDERVKGLDARVITMRRPPRGRPKLVARSTPT